MNLHIDNYLVYVYTVYVDGLDTHLVLTHAYGWQQSTTNDALT